jgi:CRP-like cAMP-binding protein
LSAGRQTRHFDMEKRFLEVFRGGRWFSGLDPRFQEDLLAAAVPRKLRKGEWLFARGDAPSGLYGLASGAVRVTATAPSGREVLLALVEPPMWFGEISVLDGQPRTHDGIAEEESLVLQVPQAALDAILAKEPRWWRDLGVLVAGKLRLTFTVMEDIVVLPLPIRLARRLVLAAERYGEWQDRSSKVIDLRQDQIAAMLSTSRQTVNQALKDLEAKGLVRLSYGNIEILDLDGLRRAAQAA